MKIQNSVNYLSNQLGTTEATRAEVGFSSPLFILGLNSPETAALSFGVLSLLSPHGSGIISAISTYGLGANSVISQSNGIFGIIDKTGQGVSGVLSSEGQGIKGNL